MVGTGRPTTGAVCPVATARGAAVRRAGRIGGTDTILYPCIISRTQRPWSSETPTTPDHSGGGGGVQGAGNGRAAGGEGGAGCGGGDAGTGGGSPSGGGNWTPNDGSGSFSGDGSRGSSDTALVEWWDASGIFREASAGAPRANFWWACALILAAVASYIPAPSPSCVHERYGYLTHRSATVSPAAA